MIKLYMKKTEVIPYKNKGKSATKPEITYQFHRVFLSNVTVEVRFYCTFYEHVSIDGQKQLAIISACWSHQVRA